MDVQVCWNRLFQKLSPVNIVHGEIHLSKAKNKEKFKLNYTELTEVQNNPMWFQSRSFFWNCFQGKQNNVKETS